MKKETYTRFEVASIVRYSALSPYVRAIGDMIESVDDFGVGDDEAQEIVDQMALLVDQLNLRIAKLLEQSAGYA